VTINGYFLILFQFEKRIILIKSEGAYVACVVEKAQDNVRNVIQIFYKGAFPQFVEEITFYSTSFTKEG
jgi:hypothetical protein